MRYRPHCILAVYCNFRTMAASLVAGSYRTFLRQGRGTLGRARQGFRVDQVVQRL